MTTLPTIYDLDETAAKLHVKRRFLVRWLHEHPADDRGQPFVSAKAGRKRLFTEAAILRILAAMAPEPIPSLSRSGRRSAVRPGVYAGRSAQSELEAALAAVTKPTRKRPPDGEVRANVVSMGGRKRRLQPPQS
jgi:hypothetical protein